MSVLASSGAAPGSRDNGHSSAAVLEFVCLFTHDLRRKQKRWQDGRLKYHTFNKRVMVYDERGNFIGDMYWRRDWDFDEGEEIELERGGVIVQVAECVGRQNQDLSELIDKRAKEKEQRAAQRPAVPFVPMHTPLSITRTPAGQRDHFQTRHRPLNQLLGTPTGHHGRALVPTESPYEQRRAADRTPDEESSSRAQKRRRHDDLQSSKMGYAQALFGAPLTLSGASMSSAPIRRPALPRPQPRIDLTSNDRTKSKQKATVYEIPDDTDDEHVHSPDAEPEPSPPQPKKATKPRERARKKTIVQAVEENVDSEPEKPPKGPVPGAAKDSGAQQAEQSVISRIEENLKAVGHGGRSGLHTVSHNNAPAPDLPPAPQEQAIRTDSPATATTDVPIPAPATVVPMGPPPRIPNPASRGRKAALKSDAAGQTPQSILPPPDPLTDRSSLLRRGNTHPAGAGGQTEARPKLKMTFPGFVSAREHDGGPWSREAHDLLGGGRPGD
ncbi:Protein of unknown function (DUF2439) domain containing protein [Naviculisporaceae sp. PSN 640]